MTAEQDIAIVDFVARHRLSPDGWCACGDFGLGGADLGEHRRHLGAAILARYERLVAKAVRHVENREQ